MMELSDIYKVCVDETRTFVRNAKFTDVVIGLSGGIDSSLVAALAMDALGAEHVHGVMLPGPYSSDHSLTDAQKLAENLDITTCTIPISAPFNAFAEVLASPCGGALLGLVAENTQARCRMVCLMALSNAHNWLLLNTGNKSEAYTGYSTLYGDTAGSFAPLGGLYKTEVFALARWRNQAARDAGHTAPIPEHVIAKPPSAELTDGQTDEASLGIDYATLDRILVEAIEQDKTASDIVALGFDAAQVESVLKRADATAFKRAFEPPYPQVDFYA